MAALDWEYPTEGSVVVPVHCSLLESCTQPLSLFAGDIRKSQKDRAATTEPFADRDRKGEKIKPIIAVGTTVSCGSHDDAPVQLIAIVKIRRAPIRDVVQGCAVCDSPVLAVWHQAADDVNERHIALRRWLSPCASGHAGRKPPGGMRQ